MVLENRARERLYFAERHGLPAERVEGLGCRFYPGAD